MVTKAGRFLECYVVDGGLRERGAQLEGWQRWQFIWVSGQDVKAYDKNVVDSSRTWIFFSRGPLSGIMWFITVSDEKSLWKPHGRFEANGDSGLEVPLTPPPRRTHKFGN
jgi:hypothetical protein